MGVRLLRGLSLALVAPLAACLESPPELHPPTCDSATDISEFGLGRDHSCALLANGGVWCWGLNDQGQLGDGTAIDRSQPSQVAGLSQVTHLAVGQDHSCATDSHGALRCWGSGSNGQLGNGATDDALEPVEADLTDVAGIALGDDFTCAVTTAGSVYCWGENEHGQAGPGFGDGVQEELPAPIDVGGAPTALVAGKNHACALLEEGRVVCWGGADVGQLGDDTLEERGTVAPVSGLAGVTHLAAGGDHTCAITDGGTLFCWGSNERGQLAFAGDSEIDTCTSADGIPLSCLPVEIDLGARALAVTAGLHHTCAAVEGGEVWCFGGNEAGQLGYGSYDDSTTPVKVSIDAPIASLAAGETQTCAVSDDRRVYCWGSNRAAQLADTAALVASTPVKVPGVTGATAIAAGDKHTCAVVGGDLECWGADDSGQLGDQQLQAKSTPTVVTAIRGAAQQLALGEEHTCIVNSISNVRCWGRSDHGEVGPLGDGDYQLDSVGVPVPVDVVQMSSGDEHACAVGADMHAYCWGSDDGGQLGDGEGGGEGVVAVGLDQVAEVSCGDEHTCVRLAGGEVNCWGANGSGQLGDGSTTSRGAPATGPLAIVSVAIEVGDAFSCSLNGGGEVLCWGDNGHGQLGADAPDSKILTPVAVALQSSATAISAGAEHACAIVDEGGTNAAWCWGRNDGGQLGDGTTVSSARPVRVLLDGEPLEIAAGDRHTCARVATGAGDDVYCWGSDIDGTLGSGRALYRSTAYGPITVCQ